VQGRQALQAAPRISLRARAVARLGGWINRIRRPVTLGVRGILRDATGRVLLVRHTYVPGWYLPGGAVDARESVGEALAREIMEETNIRITGAPRLIGIYFNRRGRSDHVVLFEVLGFEQTSAKKPDHEIAEARFFGLDDLPKATTRATRARLDEYVNGRPISAIW
jgi:8-oxo-dGTP pyrophosphatase MutT (NUDIX family)